MLGSVPATSRFMLTRATTTFSWSMPAAAASIRTFAATTGDANDNKPSPAKGQQDQQFTYIHPLSQIVLEHLQSSRQEWTQAQGLDRHLELQKDGTFILRFPSDAGRIW